MEKIKMRILIVCFDKTVSQTLFLPASIFSTAHITASTGIS